MGTEGRVELVSPVVEATITEGSLAPPLATLAGATIGLYSNEKFNATQLLDLIGETLVKEHGVSHLVRGRIMPNRVMDPGEWGPDLAACDAVIVGTGDCGSCSSSGILDVIELAAMGVPAVLVATAPFRLAIEATKATRSGLEDLRWAEVPHPIGALDRDQLVERAATAVPQVVDVLVSAESMAATA